MHSARLVAVLCAIDENSVKMMLEGGSFEVIDLGIDVEPQTFVDAVREHRPDVMGMSSLLTTTMDKLQVTIEALEEAGLRDTVKVMTRNQYLGADLSPLLLAKTKEDVIAAVMTALEQIAANAFPLRARRLAAEVALTRPDLIGLQEVYNFTLEGSNFGPPFVDHLTETLEALAAKGQNYEVAATVENLDITIPIEGIGSV